MPESPSSSFIPKRGVAKKPASVRKGNFVLLSIISYALFVSAPLASAAVFIYERHTQNQFDKAVVNLDQAIESFKEEDLKRVTDFDERLKLTKRLLESHVSIVRLLKAIETSTAQTVTFKSVDITRENPGTVAVTGLLSTSEFDGAIFQRTAYNANEIIQNPLFTEVTLLQVKAADPTKPTAESGERSVEFKVSFKFSADDIEYQSEFDQGQRPIELPGIPAEVTPATSDSDTTAGTEASSELSE